MPKACVDRLVKQGKSSKEAHKLCYPKGKAKKESNQTGIEPSGKPNRSGYGGY